MDISQDNNNKNDDIIIPVWIIILICFIIAFVIVVLVILYYRYLDIPRRKYNTSPRRYHSSSSRRGSNSSLSSPIKFYEKDQPYYQFTNFWSSPIIEPKTRHKFPTSEHYFQAQKFGFNKKVYNDIRNEPRARGAFQRANNYTKYIRSHDPRLYNRWVKWWIDDETRIDVMKRALHLKFTQHNDLRNLLLNTGNRKLVEHTRNDKFWGDGGDDTGKNMLGKLLMELRNNLRSSYNPTPPEFRPFIR